MLIHCNESMSPPDFVLSCFKCTKMNSAIGWSCKSCDERVCFQCAPPAERRTTAEDDEEEVKEVVVELLLEAGLSLERAGKGPEGNTAAHFAATWLPDTDFFRLFPSSALTDENTARWTPLTISVAAGRLDLV